MTMRTVAWLGALALLLVGFLVYDLTRPTTDQRRAEAARLVPGFDCRAVQRITITRAGQPPFTLLRQPPGQDPAWRVDPGNKRADDAAVEDLLTTLDFAEAERTADVTPEAAGLAPPAVIVALDAHTLRLGRADATGRGVFLEVTDVPGIRVAPARLRELADRDQTAFRDRRLFPLALETITALSWTDPASEKHALGREQGRWVEMVQDTRDTFHTLVLANERVEEALRRLLALRVDHYGGQPDAGMRDPQIRLVSPSGAIEVQKSLGDCPQGGLSVTRTASDGKEGACLPAAALGDLWPALVAAAKPDQRLLSQPPEGVTRIALEDRTSRLVMERQKGGWKFVTPGRSYAADPTVIADWLAKLHRTELPHDAADEPSRKLHVAGRFDESAAIRQYALGPDAKGAYALLEPDPLRFRDRTALSFAHFDVRRLRRTAPGAPPVEATTTDGDLWKPQTIDRANAARIVSALGDLKATAFQTKPPAGTPQVSLEVDVQAPGDPKPIPHTLTLHPNCTASLDKDVSFTVAAQTCDDLKLPLTQQHP